MLQKAGMKFLGVSSLSAPIFMIPQEARSTKVKKHREDRAKLH